MTLTEKIKNLLLVLVLPVTLFILSPYWTELVLSRKVIEYEVLRKQQVISGTGLSRKDWPDFKVFYKNLEINDGSYLTVLVENTGSIPVKADDYEGPLTVELSDTASVLAHKVTTKYPETLGVSSSITKGGIQIQPLLMNPGDRFVVEVIGKANIDVRGVIARIAGVHSVTEKKKVERDGIYLKKVRVWGIGSTIEKSLLRINIAFPAIITTLMLTTFFFFMRRQVKLTGYRYPIIGFAVLNYCLSLLSGVFLFVILRAQEYSIMATFGILGMIMVVSMTSGFALSRMFWEDKRDVGR